MKRIILLLCAAVLPQLMSGQEELTLEQCLDYAVEHNLSLQKNKLSLESAYQSKREVIGALLPQLSASAGLTDNIQKTKIIMPNFVNDYLPEAMRDPNAAKYMSVTMGTDLNANWGVQLSQQILNFSLYNAVGIAKSAEDMAKTGIEISRKDVMAQTATLFYNVQVLDYAIGRFDESISIMERSRRMMEVFEDNGIVRKIDADQLKVAEMNLKTEKSNLELALEVQKKLLKLQMGWEITDDIKLEKLDKDRLETLVYLEGLRPFDVYDQLPYKMVQHQQKMLDFQKKAAVSEVLPVVVLTGTYSHNYLGDDFHGPTYQHFPVSMVMLNLKVPLFTGMSKNAKIRKADIEMQKVAKDEQMLIQTLTMGYVNARNQLDQNRKTVEAQRSNKDLAEEVMRVTDANYQQGLSSLSDLLNANTSYIQAEMNYVNALNKCITAYIDLKKADGSIQEIKK